MITSIFFAFWIPGIIILLYFLNFLFTGQVNYSSSIFLICEFCCMVVLPFVFCMVASEYDCCHDEVETALFSPDHSKSLYVLIILCIISYYYASYRKQLATPVIEVILNTILLLALILNIVIAIQVNSFELALAGNLPVICLVILALVNNHKAFIKYSQTINHTSQNSIETRAWRILSLKPFIKFPILLILCLPVLIIISAALLLFGQKPDSFIRAFTEAYNRGFSQGDYNCWGDDYPCEGHYLCTVAAKGHSRIVKPQRLGVRNEQSIICNRQLLISNAFEDLLHEKVPSIHRFIRIRYNKVGRLIHRHYDIFNRKYISDLIYILMKPLEWAFLLTLYIVDRKPENRIAKQYLSKADRMTIDNIERLIIICSPK